MAVQLLRPPRLASRRNTTSTPTRQWLDHVATVGRAVQQRRLGLVRLGRRPGDDQPSRRRRRAAEAQHARTATYIKTASTPRRRPKSSSASDLELNVLMSIEDVTDTGQRGASKPEMAPPTAGQAQRAAMMNTIEKESLDKTGLRSDVVTLYQGGLYQLIQLQEIHRRAAGLRPGARHRLLRRRSRQLRVSPLRSRHLLLPRLRKRQAGQVDTLPEVERGRRQGRTNWCFVAGHPGKHRPAEHRGAPGVPPRRGISRSRCDMFAASEGASADVQRAQRRERPQRQGGSVRLPELAKARIGGLAGLQDPAIMDARPADEAELRAAGRGPKNAGRIGDAWDNDRQARGWAAELSHASTCWNAWRGRLASAQVRTSLAWSAWPEETAKPNAERLREYRESNLRSLEQQLFSDGPIYTISRPQAGRFAELTCKTCWARRPDRQKVLPGKSPDEGRARPDRQWHEAGRRRRPQAACRRRQTGHRGQRRPDDRAAHADRRPPRGLLASSLRSKVEGR